MGEFLPRILLVQRKSFQSREHERGLVCIGIRCRRCCNDETQAQTDSDKDRTDLNKKGVWTWINLGSINSSNNTVKLSDPNIRVAALRLKNGNAKFSIETSTDSTDNTQVKDSVTRGYSYEFQHTNMNHRTDKTFAKELSLDCGMSR